MVAASSLRERVRHLPVGKEDFEKELALESMDSNILDYCSLTAEVRSPAWSMLFAV